MPTDVQDLHLITRLGRGSFGEVFAAERVTPGGLRQRVAVKLLPSGLSPDHPSVKRLRDEASMLSALRHSAILAVHDLITHNDRVGLVTELIDGADLHDCIHGADPIGLKAMVEVVAHVAEALDAAWSSPGPTGEPMQLVHRDLKPANLRISTRGELKVLDFGIAQANLKDRAANTGDTNLVGSVAYMAPERLRLATDTSPRSDTFSLGCILFEGCTHARLFEGVEVQTALALAADPAEHAAFIERRLGALTSLPDALRALLASMLATSPDDRPTAAEVAATCEQLGASLDGPTLRAWAQQRSWPALQAPSEPDPPTTLDVLFGSSEADVPAPALPLDGPQARWQLGEVLLTAGATTTYRARDLQSGASHAVKVLQADGPDAEKVTERFHREAQLLRELEHPGLPRLVDAVSTSRAGREEHWLVTELIEGPTLADESARRRYSETEVLELLDEVGVIVDYLHTRQPPIVHRDLRPENLRRAADGRLVLTDLGSALDRVLDPELGGATFAGTFGYMAPEQNAGDADPRSDLYSLGALGAALLTRTSPHALVGPDHKVDFASRVRVTTETERLLDELLDPKPERRPTSIAVVRKRIDGLLRPETSTALAPASPGPAPSNWVLLPLIALLGAGLVAVVLGVPLVSGAIGLGMPLVIDSGFPSGTSSGSSPTTPQTPAPRAELPPAEPIVLPSPSEYEQQLQDHFAALSAPTVIAVAPLAHDPSNANAEATAVINAGLVALGERVPNLSVVELPHGWSQADASALPEQLGLSGASVSVFTGNLIRHPHDKLVLELQARAGSSPDSEIASESMGRATVQGLVTDLPRMLVDLTIRQTQGASWKAVSAAEADALRGAANQCRSMVPRAGDEVSLFEFAYDVSPDGRIGNVRGVTPETEGIEPLLTCLERGLSQGQIPLGAAGHREMIFGAKKR